MHGVHDLVVFFVTEMDTWVGILMDLMVFMESMA